MEDILSGGYLGRHSKRCLLAEQYLTFRKALVLASSHRSENSYSMLTVYECGSLSAMCVEFTLIQVPVLNTGGAVSLINSRSPNPEVQGQVKLRTYTGECFSTLGSTVPVQSKVLVHCV